MARKVVEAISTITRDVNGEIESEERTIKYRPDGEPEYIKLYLNTVLYLRSLPKGYNPILLAFLKRMSYATTGQKVYVNASMKREIAEEAKVSVSYINTALTDFVKGKIIFRLDTGTYQFNPKIFGKGDWKDIEKIHATITFSPEGTDFAAEIIRADQINANRKNKSEPSIEELEEAGQITILESIQEQTATKEKEVCPICKAEKVEMPKKDGSTFMGCPNWKQHKNEQQQKGA